jgi:D-glycero-D-manno-heptose 1,7-bisphosphate phosphatase
VTSGTRPFVLLDRDGTLLEEREYAHRTEDYAALPGAHQTVARLRSAGFGVVVITNQSGIGRGLFSEADYRAFEARMLADLPRGAALDGCYHCPHRPTRLLLPASPGRPRTPPHASTASTSRRAG